jgi:hypothetical protein
MFIANQYIAKKYFLTTFCSIAIYNIVSTFANLYYFYEEEWPKLCHMKKRVLIFMPMPARYLCAIYGGTIAMKFLYCTTAVPCLAS